MDYTAHGILQARILEWVAVLFSRASSQPRDPIQVSCIAGDSLPAEPLGKPKNTGVGRLSLLQQIFPTQESNWGLLHCKWIRTTWATREAQYVNSGILSITMIITTITHHHHHHHHHLKCPTGNSVVTCILYSYTISIYFLITHHFWYIFTFIYEPHNKQIE